MRLPIFNRSSLMLALALAAGVCAAWAAQQVIQGRIQQLESDARVPMAGRVVAASSLPIGTKLTAEHMAVRQCPAALVPSDSLPPERFADVAGNVLLAPLRAGDLILPVHTVQGQSNPFSNSLAEGRRAITMPVDAINSVSGLLEPGDLIDLYVSFEYRRRSITAPLLQGVLVLATGTTTQFAGDQVAGRPGSYSTVTLDTAPEDAVKLVAARQSGTITALLRHPRDGHPTQKAVRGDLASLLGLTTATPVAAQRKATVIYGNRTTSRLPGLAPPPVAPVQANGVFDLPYTPELASAWMRATATQLPADEIAAFRD
jgi:pilus assembly protein CpaB